MRLLETWAQRAATYQREHRQTLAAAFIGLLGGFSAVAFGVAPLAPDAADLPQRVVVETLEIPDLDAQLQALVDHEVELTRGDLTRSSDTPESLLARLGVVDTDASSFLRKDPTARRVLSGRAGKMIQVVSDDEGRLVRLVARYPAERTERGLTHFTRLTLERIAGQWQARLEDAPLETQVRFGSGTIRSSLFAAADEARIPDTISIQMAEIFSNEIDFRSDLRVGDRFSVVYEALVADGEPITWNEGTGRVLAAEFINAGQRHDALWFDNGSARGAYFSADGTSKQRVFLSSPLAFSRISSGFAMRMHPILRTWRQHKGVDYAAPTGTPIRTVGAGVVEFAGWQNGYGNAVEVRHGNGKSTFYAHMSRLDVRKGQRVDQGDTIGLVGSTGWSTGPHLHFEFRVDGMHKDPMLIARASEALRLPPDQRPRFESHALTMHGKLTIARSLLGVRTEAE